MRAARAFLVAILGVSASSCASRSGYVPPGPPAPRWASVEKIRLVEGREPGTTELRVDLAVEGPGENAYRVFQILGRNEIWIDVEWLKIDESLAVEGLGTMPFVKSVRAKHFPPENGREPLGRVVIEVEDPRTTKLWAPYAGSMSKSIALVFARAANEDDAMLSPDREIRLRRRGGAVGSGVIAGTPRPARPPRPLDPSKRKMALYANALDRAPIVIVAQAISHELRTLDALPADTKLGDGGYPGGGRVTFQVERVVRGQAPDVVVLELPLCRPKPLLADCLTPEELEPFTKKKVILFLSDESMSPRLAGRVDENLWLATEKRYRLFFDGGRTDYTGK